MHKAALFVCLFFAAPIRLCVLCVSLCVAAAVVYPTSAFTASLQPGHNCTPDVTAQGGGPKPVRILLQWMPQAQFAGYIMALEKGFFDEEGLPNVQLHWTNLGESPLHRLAAGEVDFATAWLITGLQRRAEGLDIVNIGQFMQHSASLIVARKDRNINSIKDLNGKIILTWGGDFGIEFELFLKRNAIVPDKILPLSDSLAPFLYGLVDATQAMEYSEYQRLIERGMKADEIVIFPLAKHNVNLVGDGLYTTKGYLQAHGDRARSVRRAVESGWDYAFSHEQEAVDAVIRYGDAWQFRSNANYQLQMLRIINRLMHSSGPEGLVVGHLARADFDSAHAIATEAGLKVAPITYENFFRAISK